MIKIWNAKQEAYVTSAVESRQFLLANPNTVKVLYERAGWAGSGLVGENSELEELLSQHGDTGCVLVRESHLYIMPRDTGVESGFFALHYLHNAPVCALFCVLAEIPAHFTRSKQLGIAVMDSLNQHNLRFGMNKILALQILDWACMDTKSKSDFLSGLSLAIQTHRSAQS